MPDEQQAYLDALRVHGHHPVHLETDVQMLAVLIGALQLTLRHPHVPRTSRTLVQNCLKIWIEDLTTLDTRFALLLRGNDPAYDVAVVPAGQAGEEAR